MKQNYENLNELEKDKLRTLENKMSEKGLLTIIAETLIHTNKATNDLNGHLADMKEQKAVEMYQNRTPTDRILFSRWQEDYVKPLKK